MKRIQQPSMQEAEQASLNHEILTTWRPGETLGEHMERRGVSRREFNKWCLKMIALMGVATVTGGVSNAQEIADKMAALKRPVVIWLQLQECTLSNFEAATAPIAPTTITPTPIAIFFHRLLF